MYKKLNIKALVIILAALVALLAVFQLTDWFKNDRSFKENLVEADTANITTIEISSIKNGTSVVLYNKNGWYVKIGTKEFPADKGDIDGITDQLIKLKPLRVAGNTENSWEKWEVTDSLAIRVVLKNNNKTMADLLIGKFSYQQASRKMTSYVRIYGEPTVYAVDGFLSMTFNRDANSFRSKTILNGTPEQWTKFDFSFPADTSFQLAKTENKWTVDGIEADSASVAQFFNNIRYLSGNEFADSVNPANLSAPLCKVLVEGNNFKAFEVSCYEWNMQKYIHTSINPDSYFKGDQIFEKLFKGRNNLSKLKLKN